MVCASPCWLSRQRLAARQPATKLLRNNSRPLLFWAGPILTASAKITANHTKTPASVAPNLWNTFLFTISYSRQNLFNSCAAAGKRRFNRLWVGLIALCLRFVRNTSLPSPPTTDLVVVVIVSDPTIPTFLTRRPTHLAPIRTPVAAFPGSRITLHTKSSLASG